jgi:hypothetical protein
MKNLNLKNSSQATQKSPKVKKLTGDLKQFAMYLRDGDTLPSSLDSDFYKSIDKAYRKTYDNRY